MKLESIKVKNFRLLADVDLSLEDRTTVIVGRNNSGKTSLTELFYRLTEKSELLLEDFSLARCEDFWEAFCMYEKHAEEKEIRALLPAIEVTLQFSYDQGSSSLGPLGDFIIDLDPASTTVIVEIKYSLKDGKLPLLLGEITKKSSDEAAKKINFLRELKERIPKHYSLSVEAVDPGDVTNRKSMDLSKARDLLKLDFINAHRPLENERTHEGNALSKLLDPIVNARNAQQASEDDKKAVEQLTEAVSSVQETIDHKFKGALEGLLPSLKEFGYPSLNDSPIKTETNLDVEKLLKDHTSLFYEGVEGVNLPEKHNGLGTRNLIYILFRLYQAFKEFQILEVAPSLQLVFIEEPEAHLHPQMQEVFIGQINSIRDVFVEKYNAGKDWPVQFIVTTHSAHVANKADFRAIRYFLQVKKDKSRFTEIRDLRLGLNGDATGSDEKFLHKYLELTRCDLFFADKAILIEGQSERLLAPKMIEKSSPDLKRQYVSTVEVGGAHAHVFFDFLKFLKLRTLIITDIDAVDDEGQNGKKCLVVDGKSTSNSCIKQWFKSEPVDYSPQTLLSKSEDEKTDDYLRIAYQIPENGADPKDCGRSFEEAFIRANSELFKDKDPYEEAKKHVREKADFALGYAIGDETWIVPKYISEGLKWLGENPSDQVISVAGTPEKLVVQEDASSGE